MNTPPAFTFSNALRNRPQTRPSRHSNAVKTTQPKAGEFDSSNATSSPFATPKVKPEPEEAPQTSLLATPPGLAHISDVDEYGMQESADEADDGFASESEDDDRPKISPLLHRSHASAPAVMKSPRSARKSSVYERLGTSAIDEVMQKLLEGSPAKEERSGNNYVFQVGRFDGDDTIVKVGQTAYPVEERRRQIEKACGYSDLQRLNGGQRPIVHFKKAERLIKAELHNSIHHIECNCTTPHSEYFKVSPDAALEATQRWTSFCERKPWDSSGRLYPFWRERLANRLRCGDKEEDNLELRAKRWNHFANPTIWDVFYFNLVSLKCSIQPYGWQWVALLQASYVAYAMLPDLLGTLYLVLLLVSIIIDRHLREASLYVPRKIAVDKASIRTSKQYSSFPESEDNTMHIGYGGPRVQQRARTKVSQELGQGIQKRGSKSDIQATPSNY